MIMIKIMVRAEIMGKTKTMEKTKITAAVNQAIMTSSMTKIKDMIMAAVAAMVVAEMTMAVAGITITAVETTILLLPHLHHPLLPKIVHKNVQPWSQLRAILTRNRIS